MKRGRSFGHGYFTLVARSGREYLVNFTGRGLHSRVYPPSTWHEPFRSLGLRHELGVGAGLGRGGVASVESRARRWIARREFGIAWRAFWAGRDRRRLSRFGTSSGSGS